MDDEIDDPRSVIEWEGFISENDGDDLFCRLSDTDAPGGDTTEVMTIPKAQFLKLLAESQPERAKEVEEDGFALGLIFRMRVDGDNETVTITLPPPWTEEEIAANRQRGEEMAEAWRQVFEKKEDE